MSNMHTEYVLEHHGADTALEFHITTRCYPPVPMSMKPMMQQAISHYKAGDYDAAIRLPEGCSFRGRKWHRPERLSATSIWSHSWSKTMKSNSPDDVACVALLSVFAWSIGYMVGSMIRLLL